MAVHLTVPADTGQNRLWGIPYFGVLVRAILTIPQLVVLALLAIVAYVLIFVSWIPILIMGRQSTGIVNVMASLLRLQARVTLYVALVTGRYPWFNDQPDGISVWIDPGEPQNRLWGIPFIGILVRWILLIPHLLILWVLGIGVSVLALVSWVPVLVNGRQAGAIVRFVGDTYGYALRVVGYLLLLTGEYPPFRLGEAGAPDAPAAGAPLEQPAT